jgi:hypothetical protein
MKAIELENIEQSIATGDTLRLIVDTTPSLIHTGQPDGYLDMKLNPSHSAVSSNR